MISRASRLRGRHRDARGQRWRPRVVEGGATDEFAGLGRVEQLVLRGDGLTTTSLEILTGRRVEVEVVGHSLVAVPDPGCPGGLDVADDASDLEGRLAAACARLGAAVGDPVLVRDVLLVGAAPGPRPVFGTAEVVARPGELPAAVAHALATTDHPIGRLLRDHDVPVARELYRWGLIPAGPLAHRLGPDLHPTSRVPGREYVMRNTATGRAFAMLVERFAPSVFATGPGSRAAR